MPINWQRFFFFILYVIVIYCIVDKLAEMEVDINPDLLSTILLRSFPESYENFRCAITSRDELHTPEVLRIKIGEESDTRKDVSWNEIQSALAVRRAGHKNAPRNASTPAKQLSFDSFKKDAKITCYDCALSGIEREIARNRKNQEAAPGEAARRMYQCSHKRRKCDTRLFRSNMADGRHGDWIAAAHHICATTHSHYRKSQRKEPDIKPCKPRKNWHHGKDACLDHFRIG